MCACPLRRALSVAFKSSRKRRSKRTDMLSALCFDKDADYQVHDIDRYGRAVAVVTCASVDMNRAQLDRGMAWVYPKYNKDLSLLCVQDQAREGRRGLWFDAEPVPPWEFRRSRRSEWPHQRSLESIPSSSASHH
jgi:micrococcal nuclease